MSISAKDRAIVRDAARKVRALADLPVMEENKKLWLKINKLEKTRPAIRIMQDAWHDLSKFVKLECTDKKAREEEWRWKSTLWNWELMPDDDIFLPYFHSWFIVSTEPYRYGIPYDLTRPSEDVVFGAAHYNTVLGDDADPDEIVKPPVVKVDREATEREFQFQSELYGDIFDVRRPGPGGGGQAFFWFSIMDEFIQWRGLDKMFVDLCDRPEYVHRWMRKFTDWQLSQLDQYEELGVLSLNNDGKLSVGPGGMNYTDQLPQKDYDGLHVRPKDMWSHATTQIFTEVSPAMHEEFALRYEGEYLARFGLASYGCCEPLDRKVDVIARNIPNLRRLSMSPWVDPARGAEAIGRKFIFSYKPNPAIFSGEQWDLGYARKVLKDALDKTRGCVVEVIMKDLHETHCEPHRLTEWTKMAKELAEEYA